MRLRLLRAAQSDIRAEKAYYRKLNPELAERFQTVVQKATQAITFQPLAMQVIELDIRRWPIDGGFPHGILYRIEGEDILVIAVFHPKQSPQKWAARSSM
jgi:plasmid stabilization system protein ParE